jgi:hypothetical protein
MDEIKKYNSIRKINLEYPKKISTFIPNPIEDDYVRGYVTRFFIQKTNDIESPIYEVSSKQFSKYTHSYSFKGISLRWRIKGPMDTQFNDKNEVIDKGVKESNRIAIRIASDKIKNLKLYLPNLLQFYK